VVDVVDADGDLGIDVVEGLESLADKSLVRIEPAAVGGAGEPAGADGEARFSFHPLLREYAFEQLEASAERPAIEARFAAVVVGIAESAGRGILAQTGGRVMRLLDREDRNLRAAIDWTLANDRPDLGLRIMGAIWRWFQQRGRLREARGLLAGLLAQPLDGDIRIRIAGLAAEGGLAYWMNDFPASRLAYEERLALATETGDPLLMADGHYDLGFLSMVSQEGALLRQHEERALELFLLAGDEQGVIRARQALVLAVFLAGEYATACELENQNLAAFRRAESSLQIADSLTLLSAVNYRLGEPETSWRQLTEALGLWGGIDSSAGLARALGMAAIVLLDNGDADLGARVAGSVYRLVREKGVMLAPVQVLHLPDPAWLADLRLGPERAAELIAEGDRLPVEEALRLVLATASPTGG
jgi:hypothetical protein